MNLNIDAAKKTAQRLSGLLVTYSTLIIGILILVALIIWCTDKMTLNTRNCTNMNNLTKALKPTAISNFVPSSADNIGAASAEIEPFRRLGDYFIKTAYNCCCAGNYKNDFVNICALNNCILQGARGLDFEIYSIDGKPCIAASSVSDDSIKETYNSVPFAEALNEISNYAFSGNINKGDPIFLNLRIMSKNKGIYDKMANDLERILGSRLLKSCNSYNNRDSNIADIPIGSLIENLGEDGNPARVVVFADFQYEDEAFIKTTKLWEYVNAAANDKNTPYYTLSRFNNMKSEHPDDMIKYNNSNMSMCIPDLAEKAKNYNYVVALGVGCQFIAMEFQKEDPNMQAYTDFFNSHKSAIVRKDAVSLSLLAVRKCMEEPSKKPNYLKPLSWNANENSTLDEKIVGNANLNFSI